MRAQRPPKPIKNVADDTIPCNTARCQIFKIMQTIQTFKSISGALASIHNCITANIVYIMTLNVCNKQYVGKTKMTLNKRINLHRSEWKTHIHRFPIEAHFSKSDNTFENTVVCCIEGN